MHKLCGMTNLETLRRYPFNAFLFSIVVAAAVACGSSSTAYDNEGDAGGGGDAAASLGSVCSALCACVQPSDDKCIPECLSARQWVLPTCEAELLAETSCEKSAMQTITCDGGLTAEQLGSKLAAACGAEVTDMLACTACVAQPDNPCSDCNAKNCCAQRQAAFSHPDARALSECALGCGYFEPKPECLAACEAQFPAATAAAQQAQLCAESKCGGC